MKKNTKSKSFIEDIPVLITCRKCGVNDLSEIKYRIKNKTWIATGLTCVFCFPFFWVPLCFCKLDNKHYCRNCGAKQ